MTISGSKVTGHFKCVWC